MRQAVLIALLAFTASSPAAASEVVPLPRFKALELRGGGEIVLRHGPVQRVTIIEGDSNISRLEVPGPSQERIGRDVYRNSGESLVIRACRERCPRNYRLRVEIVSPEVAAIAISGGGSIRTEGAFPHTDAVALAVSGGGMIDGRALRADAVGASVNGGGLISTHPRESLGASVQGGGTIRYWGSPSVGQNVRGGGEVVRVGGD
jgi:hypothetical protein